MAKRKIAAKKSGNGHLESPSGTNGVFFGWRPDIPDHRDLPYAALRLPLEKPIALPTQIDLRTRDSQIYNQGDLGSCTGNAVAGAFEFDRRKQQLPDFLRSRLFIYYNERSMEGTT